MCAYEFPVVMESRWFITVIQKSISWPWIRSWINSVHITSWDLVYSIHPVGIYQWGFFFFIRATYAAHYIFLSAVNLTILDEGYKLWSSSLCDVLKYLPTGSEIRCSVEWSGNMIMTCEWGIFELRWSWSILRTSPGILLEEQNIANILNWLPSQIQTIYIQNRS
jgi:hypothetical protein